MGHERVVFSSLSWKQGGHPLEKKKTGDLGGMTLLRFEQGFSDPNWCVNGHVGYVIEGVLRLEYQDTIVDIGPGEAFVIDPDTPHRASNPGDNSITLFIAAR
jgi:quercetin dioxygenase-like cupin family protein